MITREPGAPQYAFAKSHIDAVLSDGVAPSTSAATRFAGLRAVRALGAERDREHKLAAVAKCDEYPRLRARSSAVTASHFRHGQEIVGHNTEGVVRRRVDDAGVRPSARRSCSRCRRRGTCGRQRARESGAEVEVVARREARRSWDRTARKITVLVGACGTRSATPIWCRWHAVGITQVETRNEFVASLPLTIAEGEPGRHDASITARQR